MSEETETEAEEPAPPEPKKCDNCDGYMPWCSICQCYTRTCCVDYGTCMCS